MSYHFYVETDKQIKYKDFINKLNTKDLTAYHQYEENDFLLEKNFFYIRNKSSRGILFTFKNNQYDIITNSLCSKDDYQLAINIAMAIAELTNSIIISGDNNELDLNQFKEKYSENWIESFKSTGINPLLDLILEQNGEVKISGCKTDFYIGKNLLSQFKDVIHNEILLYEEIVKIIIDLQFIENKGYRIPNFFDGELHDGTIASFITILADYKQFLPKADFYLIHLKAEDKSYKISYDELKMVLNSKFKFIDECQYLVEEMSQKELKELVTQHLKVKNIQDKKIETDKKWWKFWK